jgi:hypothetical protein
VTKCVKFQAAGLYAKTLQIENLNAQLAELRRVRFGRSSEKLDREIEQLELTLAEIEQGVAESKTRTTRAASKAPTPATRTGEDAKHFRTQRARLSACSNPRRKSSAKARLPSPPSSAR